MPRRNSGSDVLRDHRPAGADFLCEQQGHDAGSGPDVGDDHARFERKRFNNGVALLVNLPSFALEGGLPAGIVRVLVMPG